MKKKTGSFREWISIIRSLMLLFASWAIHRSVQDSSFKGTFAIQPGTDRSAYVHPEEREREKLIFTHTPHPLVRVAFRFSVRTCRMSRVIRQFKQQGTWSSDTPSSPWQNEPSGTAMPFL